MTKKRASRRRAGPAAQGFQSLLDTVARLRGPQGCPWDRAQTHTSLKPSLLEEAYEVVAALDDGDPQKLHEELGDLLLQIVFHAQMAAEASDFTMNEVVNGITEKLVRRHPHVFGRDRADTPQEVMAHWEAIKRAERGEERPLLEDVPTAMPALAYSQSLLERAGRAGFQWPGAADVLTKLAEELRELARAQDHHQMRDEFGDILFNLVNYARYLEIDAEEALRLAANKFRQRFSAMEEAARGQGTALADLSLEQKLALWQAVKAP